MNTSNPVMADVAKLARVSVPTVSRVLNNPDAVREQTKQRVEAAIKALGYRPNLAARMLVTQQTKLIGVMTPSGTLFGPQSASDAIQQAAFNAGYSSVVAAPAYESDFDATLDRFRALGVDGIVVIAPTYPLATEAANIARSIPTVMISVLEEVFAKTDLGIVSIDHEGGSRSITEHLIEHGHRRIAYISGPSTWLEARARTRGWLTAMNSHGLATDLQLTASWNAESAVGAARRLLSINDRPSAIVAANDSVAMATTHVAANLGLRCPEDIAIVGYDNTSDSRYYSPPLTTVEQPFADAGEASVHMLVDMINNASMARQSTTLQTSLVVRQSCGCS